MIPIIDSYDINCHYKINLAKRMLDNFSEVPKHVREELITWLIPKLHIQGHKVECQYIFSCNYTQGTGRFYGELVETGWPAENKAGTNTQEMNPGHRQDTVNTVHGYANWEKVERMGTWYNIRMNAIY